MSICKQLKTKVSHFEAHFGRCPNTTLSNISTTSKRSNLT